MNEEDKKTIGDVIALLSVMWHTANHQMEIEILDAIKRLKEIEQ